VAALLDDCVTAAADHLIHAAGGPAFDERSYARLRALFRDKLAATTLQVLHAVRAVLTAWHRVQAQLSDLRAPLLAAGVADITAQVEALVGPGFATAAGANRLADVARYLQAVERRIEKLRVDPSRDADWTAQVGVVADEYAAELAALPPGVEPGPALREVRWMIEELRVGLYAHPMRTRHPVSIKRIQKAIDDLH
jgi:ATP-dependent helicase HrpA